MNAYSKDRHTYSLALLAVVLAFSTFKDGLKSVPVPFGFFATNLLLIGGIFAALLVASAYFFAVGHFLHGTKFQNSQATRWVFSFADKLYVLGMFLPISLPALITIGLFMKFIAGLASDIAAKDLVLSFGLVSSLSQVVAILLITNKLFDLRRSAKNKAKSAEFGDAIEEQLKSAEELYKNQFYGSTALEAYKVIELAIRERLETQDYYTNTLNAVELLKLAKSKKIIDTPLENRVHELRQLRNKAAHSITSFDKNAADFALGVAQEVLQTITPVSDQ